VPALLLGPDDAILEANLAAELFLNLASRALRGAPVWDKVMIDAPIEEAFRRARSGRAALFVNDVDVGSGERPPAQCNIQVAPLQGADGHMLMLISPREMASRMTQNAGSHKAAKSVVGLAEMLAHEVKNPLAGIAGAAQLLSMGLKGADRELTDLIVEETRRIVKLLEQVERFGDTRRPRLCAVNIHDALDRARQSARLGFGAQMTFVEDYDPSLPHALADPDMLLQVIMNLVKNACEAAGQEGGTIRLRTFYDAALRLRGKDGVPAPLPLQIEVVDDGPGVPPEIAAEIFEPFVSGRENGTGLGLALVAKLLGDMGGWIAADSAPGRTVFRVSLPVAPREAGEG
jgi:two-component system nitrogen regulation sensor histidine kinase GlnL